MEADFVKYIGDIGAVGLMFLAWWALHRSTFNLLEKMIKSSNDNFNAIIQRQRDAEERNYEVLKGLAEDIKIIAASLGRVEMKVDNLKTQFSERRYKHD